MHPCRRALVPARFQTAPTGGTSMNPCRRALPILMHPCRRALVPARFQTAPTGGTSMNPCRRALPVWIFSVSGQGCPAYKRGNQTRYGIGPRKSCLEKEATKRFCSLSCILETTHAKRIVEIVGINFYTRPTHAFLTRFIERHEASPDCGEQNSCDKLPAHRAPAACRWMR